MDALHIAWHWHSLCPNCFHSSVPYFKHALHWCNYLPLLLWYYRAHFNPFSSCLMIDVQIHIMKKHSVAVEEIKVYWNIVTTMILAIITWFHGFHFMILYSLSIDRMLFFVPNQTCLFAYSFSDLDAVTSVFSRSGSSELIVSLSLYHTHMCTLWACLKQRYKQSNTYLSKILISLSPFLFSFDYASYCLKTYAWLTNHQ